MLPKTLHELSNYSVMMCIYIYADISACLEKNHVTCFLAYCACVLFCICMSDTGVCGPLCACVIKSLFVCICVWCCQVLKLLCCLVVTQRSLKTCVATL